MLADAMLRLPTTSNDKKGNTMTASEEVITDYIRTELNGRHPNEVATHEKDRIIAGAAMEAGMREWLFGKNGNDGVLARNAKANGGKIKFYTAADRKKQAEAKAKRLAKEADAFVAYIASAMEAKTIQGELPCL